MKQKDKDMMTSERERKTENMRQTIEKKYIEREPNKLDGKYRIGIERGSTGFTEMSELVDKA